MKREQNLQEPQKQALNIPVVSGRLLTFDEWYDLNEETINIELAESGADRELDFDSEREFGKRYEIYLDDDH